MTTDNNALPLTWYMTALTPELGDISFPINVSMSVGRHDSNDVVLATPQISRQHAKFNQVGKNLFVQDLGSSNGTFVNGERIGTQAVQVQPNDEIAFADLVFMIVTEDTLVHDTLVNEHASSYTDNQDTNPVTKATEPDFTTSSSDTVYKIKDTITPPLATNSQSDIASNTNPIATIESLNTHTTKDTLASPALTTATNNHNESAMNPPMTANANSTIIKAETDHKTSSKKSPLIWIIAVIAIVIIASMLIKAI